jgi:hypothetical protein
MLMRTFKGVIGLLLVVGAFGGTSVAVATVSRRSSTVSTGASTQAAPAPAARRRPRVVVVDEGCRELPVAPVVPPSPASCS